MTSQEIRQAFVRFFIEKGHHHLPSASLIPDDPTLLLTIAGMVPFKPIFLGRVYPPFRRVCTIQKCVRVSDVEKVGYTSRHHTFFEMLGNFSFGDYFKREACRWAWEFLTQNLGLSAEKLWVSVHHRDQETFTIWEREIGIPSAKIIRLGDEDNFWSSGPVGPCGYCSEIYYDTGPQQGCGQPTCRPGCDCDRYLEVWNLVFMEFDRQGDGSLLELPRKNIDTGMGLERIASVMQKTETNFETDLFLPIVREVEKMSGQNYESSALRPPFRIIVDHIRAITFLVADGVYPSNEGRGYVLRRLIRRAYRQGKKLSLNRPFLYELACTVIDTMSIAYPELTTKERVISQIILQEEKRFQETMSLGIEYLETILREKQNTAERILSGREVFRLYDTYGFPPDLTQEILAEEGFSYNEEEFLREMDQQRERARRAYEMKTEELKDKKSLEELFSGGKSTFVGYENHTTQATVLSIADKNSLQNEAHQGEQIMVVLDVTPFYPEKGGQECDRGWIFTPSGRMEVEYVFAPSADLIVHEGVVKEGTIRVGDRAKATIDTKRRKILEIHHTTTHLLHRSLQKVLGEQVRQAGSHVGEERLRFDFTHFAPLTEEELYEVERLVNEQISAGLPVYISYSTLDEVQRRGVIALFEEKYEDIVRIVRAGEYSAELCGGTHLRNTSEAGIFKILSETSIGSGIRRIEAVAGPKAWEVLQEREKWLEEVRKILEVKVEKIPLVVTHLVAENKKLQKACLREEKEKIVHALTTRWNKEGKKFCDYLLRDTEVSLDQLREIIDAVRNTRNVGILVLGLLRDNKVQGLVAEMNPQPTIDLGNLVKAIAKEWGGGGGGKPHLAQFGGIKESEWTSFVATIKRRVSDHEEDHGP